MKMQSQLTDVYYGISSDTVNIYIFTEYYTILYYASKI